MAVSSADPLASRLRRGRLSMVFAVSSPRNRSAIRVPREPFHALDGDVAQVAQAGRAMADFDRLERILHAI